jgi:hypothetical protein
MQRSEYRSWLTEESKHSALFVQGGFTMPQQRRIFSPWRGHTRVSCAGKSGNSCHCKDRGTLYSSTARDPIFDRHWEKKIKARDAKTLVKVFSVLVRRLHACKLVIFCLIDAVAKLETPTRRGVREGTEKVLSELRDLVQERKRGSKRKASDRMVFKLLVSAGAMRVDAERFFDKRDTADLAAGVGFQVRRR